MDIMTKCSDFVLNSYKKICNYIYEIPSKRYSLLILSLLGMLSNKKYRNDLLILFLITFISSCVTIYNFDILATWNNSKPLYYEDLYVDYDQLPTINLVDSQKKMFKKTYTRILIISNSLLTSSIIIYWKIKSNDSTSFIEVIGVTGGLLKIASLLNIGAGKITLYLIKTYINIKVFIENENENENDDIVLRKESIGSQCSLDDILDNIEKIKN